MSKMFLPIACRKGTCDHEQHGIPCTMQERRCLSGECTHAMRGQACPTVLPQQQPPHRTTPAEVQPTRADATALDVNSPHLEALARPEVRAALGKAQLHALRGDPLSAAVAHTEAIMHMVRPPALRRLEGGTGPGVLADQTRERPDIIPPALAAVASGHLDPDAGSEDGPPIIAPMTGFDLFLAQKYADAHPVHLEPVGAPLHIQGWQSGHLDGCSAPEDPDGETMCVCASIEREGAGYVEYCTGCVVDHDPSDCGYRPNREGEK